MSVAYICNGLDPECSDKIGCFRCGRPGMQYCNHTLNKQYAVNGECKDPWNHPERFTDFSIITGEEQFWEGPIDFSLAEIGQT